MKLQKNVITFSFTPFHRFNGNCTKSFYTMKSDTSPRNIACFYYELLWFLTLLLSI